VSGGPDKGKEGPSRGRGGPSLVGETLHASCVAWQDRGVLICGPSGSGKSALALQLMALGCTLVADDRTQLARRGDDVLASAPATIAGRIEARHVGLLNATPAAAPVPLSLIVDLSQHEEARLPPSRIRSLLGKEFALVFGRGEAYFPAAILQYLKGGRYA